MGLIGLVPIWKLRERILVFVLPVLYLLVHVILFGYGLYSSGGYLLFLLPLAPFTAIAAALGFEWVLGLIGRGLRLVRARRSTALMTSATVLYLSVVLLVGLRHGSLGRPMSRFSLLGRPPNGSGATIWWPSQFSQRMCTSTTITLSRCPGEKLWTILPSLDSVEVGTIALWDRHYSNGWGLRLADLKNAENGWEKLQEFGGGAMILFQKRIDTSGRVSR